MSEIGKVISPLLAVTGIFNKPKAPAVQSQPVVDRQAQAVAAARVGQDEIRRRRGAGANELTGGGAEASTPGAKVLLGQ